LKNRKSDFREYKTLTHSRGNYATRLVKPDETIVGDAMVEGAKITHWGIEKSEEEKWQRADKTFSGD
jgi:hypothetical protein